MNYIYIRTSLYIYALRIIKSFFFKKKNKFIMVLVFLDNWNPK